MPAVARPLWDVVEEHLDEASFLGSQWERGLDSPDTDLAQFAGGVERRLLAHLDALLVGGPPVAERTLVPALADEHRPTCFAAALALLALPDTRDAVLAAWAQADGPQRAPLTRALACSPAGAELVRAALTDADPGRRADALEILGFHRALRTDDVPPLLAERDPAVRAALVRVAIRTGDARLASVVHAELSAPTPGRAAAALTAAAILGLPEFPDARRAALPRLDECGDRALLLLALTGDGEPALLADERPAAIFALGFTGSHAAAERCLVLASAGRHVALAFEAFCHLTGATLPHLPRPDEDPLPPLAEEDLENVLASRPEDALPLPDLAAWTAWWQTHRDRLRSSLPGRPGDRPALLAALQRAPMRRRHAVALRLAIVTRGRDQLETRASARRQYAGLRRLGA
jgi:uncharacterized protein (TIGR02270 family)